MSAIISAARLRAARLGALLRADLNGDGFCGQTDLDIVLDEWGNSAPLVDPQADASGDGFVGQTDLDIVLDDWGQSAP